MATGYRRFQIRQRFGIQGSECGDYAAWLCCPTLALCQETRTLAANQVEDGVWAGWRGPQASPVVTRPVHGFHAAAGYTPVQAQGSLHAFGGLQGGGLYSPVPSAPLPPFPQLPTEPVPGHLAPLHMRPPGIAATESSSTTAAGNFYIPRKQ